MNLEALERDLEKVAMVAADARDKAQEACDLAMALAAKVLKERVRIATQK